MNNTALLAMAYEAARLGMAELQAKIDEVTKRGAETLEFVGLEEQFRDELKCEMKHASVNNHTGAVTSVLGGCDGTAGYVAVSLYDQPGTSGIRKGDHVLACETWVIQAQGYGGMDFWWKVVPI